MCENLANPAARARTTAFATPPGPDYDPSKDTSEYLNRIGIPAKPDQALQPLLYGLWLETFGRTLRFLNPFAPPNVLPRRWSPAPDYKAADGASPAYRFDSSENWSGASLDTRDGGRFRQIWGRWTVPDPNPPQAGQRLTDVTYECSTWIGFDGQRRYVHSTLPQAGTTQKVIVGPSEVPRKTACAWVQWWARDDNTTLPVCIQGFDVKPGDQISCVLTVLDDHSVMCTLVNNTTDPPTVTAVRLDAPDQLDAPGSQYSVSGAHAEWVMERPGIVDGAGVPIKDTLHALPDFGSTTFDSCHAVEVFDEGKQGIERTLENAQYVRMFDRQYNPPRTAYISVPERIDDTSFRTTYVG